MTTEPLHLLHLEDDPADAELVAATLAAQGVAPRLTPARGREEYVAALERGGFDLIVSDYAFPDFSGREALEMARRLAPEVPFIFVSGAIGEAAAIESLVSGATDYVLKDRIARLAPAVQRALAEAHERRERKKAQQALAVSEAEQRRLAELQTSILDALPAKIALLDAQGTIVSVNQSWRRFGEANAADWASCGLGANYLAVCDRARGEGAENARAAASGIRELLAGRNDFVSLEYPCHSTEHKRWFRCMAVPLGAQHGGAVIMHVDVTDRREAQERLLFLAHFDSLTQLPNRVLFQDRLNQAIAGAQRNARLIAVLFIDLDRFKVINDTLGHGAGDALLRQVAERLSSHLRAGDTVGRLGGDEFAVILGDLGQAEDAGLVAQKLLDAFGPPFYLEGREVFITPSIGITVFPYDGIDSDVLVRNADAAMYRAKDLGRNTYHFYTAALNARAFENLRLETDLRRALERGEFVLHYQPKASLATGEVTGLEALLRWRRPDNGLVAPGEFIPLLEETGLIVGVGAWVLRAVCAQLKQWREAELAPIPVALNLSARQFHHRDLAKTVEDTLREYTVDPALIEFELTESSLMANPGEAAAIMRGFKALGIRLAVDDFGTGYSSLSHLKRFPLDSVKIDRSFVRDIIADSDDASIIRAVITMAHSLKLKVVAEGVETDSQLAFLAANRCDEMQGYFFSKPLPAEEVTDLLRSGRRLDVALPAGRPPRRTLLAVDDEANILSALKRLLRREGYDILTASSAREGLELLARHQVGVIVSDQRMPEMTGVEFLSRVKELHPGTVRIVLSGYTDLTTVQEAINEGAIYKFLTKPWDDDQLRAQIAEAFRSHELAMENERLNDELTAANTELQRLLRDKSEQAERGELYLGIAQETLQTIPFPVIGVDDGGMIAMANREAEVLCGNGGALLGGFAHEALPQGLLACLADDAAPATARVEVNGRRFDVLRQTMGGQSCSQGKVLVMVPCQGVNGAPH